MAVRVVQVMMDVAAVPVEVAAVAVGEAHLAASRGEVLVSPPATRDPSMLLAPLFLRIEVARQASFPLGGWPKCGATYAATLHPYSR